MESFNDYREQVREILDFAYSDKLLSGGILPEGIKARVIHSLREIPSQDDYYERGVKYNWDDIISTVDGEIYRVEMEKWPQSYPFNKFTEMIQNELWENLGKCFNEEYVEFGVDCYVVGFFVEFIHCRLVMGKSNEFYETLFKIYQSGGYPCGWEGNYPDGRLIVYYPKK